MDAAVTSFAGRTAVVTGAGRGLGAAYARGFAAAGARIIGVDIDPAVDTVASELGGVAHRCDLADADAMARTAAAILADASEIAVLINNAGIAYGDIQDRSRLASYDQGEWLRFLAVNTVAPILLGNALRPALVAAEGVILNQSSMASSDPVSAYAVTKAALNAMTRAMAASFAADGVRVAGIAPGLIAAEARDAGLSDHHSALVRDGQLLDRDGTADDVVALALFLASDAARFITGEVIFCDGGSHHRHWRY